MMRVYICPDCGWMRMVSRRKNVECYKCGVQDMTLAKVDFATYVSWSEKERQEYACLLYTSPSARDRTRSRMPSSA